MSCEILCLLYEVFSPKDKETRKPRGFTFCQYRRREDAEDAVKGMDKRVGDMLNCVFSWYFLSCVLNCPHGTTLLCVIENFINSHHTKDEHCIIRVVETAGLVYRVPELLESLFPHNPVLPQLLCMQWCACCPSPKGRDQNILSVTTQGP